MKIVGGHLGWDRPARESFLSFAPPHVTDGDIEEVVAALRSGWLTTGPRVRSFEQDFSTAVDAPAALAVTSCTAALHLALCALEIRPREAVVSTTMTFCSTIHTIEQVHATPVLVDIEPDTLNISPTAVERVLEAHRRARVTTPRPVAILPVHYAGHACDMSVLYDMASHYGLAVIDDAAHALGASSENQLVGSGPSDPDIRWMTAFSFYATKNITTGEGGMLTGPEDLVEKARPLSLHGLSRDAWNRYGQGASWAYDVEDPGFKYNMTDVQAALGLSQLRRLDDITARRREIAARYSEGLSTLVALELPVERPGFRHAWHLYPIRLRLEQLTIGRNEFMEQLAARQIGASVHFIPVHMLAYYRKTYSFEDDQFPVASSAFDRLVSLPLYPSMTDADVDDVLAAVTDIVTRNHG